MTAKRSSAVDTIRMAALIGICVVNVPFLALPIDKVMSAAGSGADRAAFFVVTWLFQSKFFLLFSFLFGWGMQIQRASAARDGAGFGARYARRLTALAVFGALHAVLVFTGDILLLYALLGVLLWPVRHWPVRRLLWLAGGMVPVAVVALLVMALSLGEPVALGDPRALGGSFAEATAARWTEWPATFGFLVLLQGPLAYGAFLCGLAAAKAGFFDAGSTGRQRLARAAPWLLGVGLVLNGLIALAPGGETLGALGALLAMPIAAPILSAAWLYYLIRLDAALRLPAVLIRAGRNSLTAYVLQGVLGGVAFGAYGLGLFGTLGHAVLLPLSIVLALAAMAITGALATRTGRAPLEAVLRAATRGWSGG